MGPKVRAKMLVLTRWKSQSDDLCAFSLCAGIREVGEATAVGWRLISASLDMLQAATIDELQKVLRRGDCVVATHVFNFCRREQCDDCYWRKRRTGPRR